MLRNRRLTLVLKKHVLAKLPSIEYTKKIFEQRKKEHPPLPNDLKSVHSLNEVQVIKFGEQELSMVTAVFNYFERTCNGAINPRSKDGSRRIALISGLYETDHS